jgi:hypothetical protein
MGGYYELYAGVLVCPVCYEMLYMILQEKCFDVCSGDEKQS